MLSLNKRKKMLKDYLIIMSVCLISIFILIVSVSHYMSAITALKNEVHDSNVNSLNLMINSVSDIISEQSENNFSKSINISTTEMAETHFTENPILYMRYDELFLDINDDIDISFLYIPEFEYMMGVFPWSSNATFVYENSDRVSDFTPYLGSNMQDDVFFGKLNGTNYLMSYTPVRDNKFDIVGYFYSGTEVNKIIDTISDYRLSESEQVVIYSDNQVLLSAKYLSVLDEMVVDYSFNNVSQITEKKESVEQNTSYFIEHDDGELFIASFGNFDGFYSVAQGFAGFPIYTVIAGSIILAAFCFIMIKLLYTPIGKITSRVLSKNNSLQNVNEFKIIEEYINDLAVKNTKFENLYEKNNRKLRENEILLLISKNHHPFTDDVKNLFRYNCFVPCVINVTNSEASNRVDITEIIKLIELKFISKIKQNNIGIDVLEVGVNEILILINIGNEYEKVIHALSKYSVELETSVKEEVGHETEISVCIGQAVTSVDRIYNSYTKAKYMLGFTEKFTNLNIANTAVNAEYTPLSVFRKKLLKAIVEKNITNIRNILEEVQDCIESGKFFYKHEEVDNFFLRCITETIQAISLTNKDIYHLKSETLNILSFINLSSLEEKVNWMNKFYSDTLETIQTSEASNSYSEERISKALEYIANNFKEDISLDSVADYLGIHPAYFSSYFKKFMNVGFNEYLNSARVKHAENMLLDNKKSLNTVAKDSGYLNYQSFSRAFKKIHLVTPRQYRENMANLIFET